MFPVRRTLAGSKENVSSPVIFRLCRCRCRYRFNFLNSIRMNHSDSKPLFQKVYLYTRSETELFIEKSSISHKLKYDQIKCHKKPCLQIGRQTVTLARGFPCLLVNSIGSVYENKK